jgi:uncharacterized glyoxalase superfamily protein PhnB
MTTDPFEVLREPMLPIAPSPEFTDDLRRRVVDAFGIDDLEHHAPEVREYTPARFHALNPYLACRGADRAISWYVEVFGADVLGEPIVMPDGTIGHAELRVGDAVFMVADEYAVEGVRGPDQLGATSVSLMLYVPDADATIARALARGATEVRPLAFTPHGTRTGIIRDPFGHRWMVGTHLEPDDRPVEDAPGRRFGDVGYITIEAPDGDRARRFYEALFGWRLRGQEGNYHIASITPPSGIHGGAPAAEMRIFFRVDDVEVVAARVRELGGEVLSINEYASGGNAECVDDQGLRFDLFRPRPGY